MQTLPEAGWGCPAVAARSRGRAMGGGVTGGPAARGRSGARARPVCFGAGGWTGGPARRSRVGDPQRVASIAPPPKKLLGSPEERAARRSGEVERELLDTPVLMGSMDAGEHDVSYSTVVLLRHGQSTWNLENRFTGWADVPLTAKGEKEAIHAGKLLLERGYKFDVAFTSGLARAQHTADLTLNHALQRPVPLATDWRLNERHYGALQGLVKDDPMLRKIHGEEQLVEWRRSYQTRPPAMTPSHPLWQPPPAPLTESLKDCEARVRQCWEDRISPNVRQGKSVLVVAHANTIRALVKTIDGITDEDIRQIKIPNGAPLVYRLDKELKPVDTVDDLNFSPEFLISPVNHEKVKNYCRCKNKLIRSVFQMIDRDEDGKITQKDLCTQLLRLGTDFDSEFLMEEVEDMLREIDVEEEGVISYEEFVRSHEIIDENMSRVTHFGLLG